MAHRTLLLRAFEVEGSPDELPDGLTLEELANLRAWSMDGLDSAKAERLLQRMNNQVVLNKLSLTTVHYQEQTFEFRVTQRAIRDWDWDSPFDTLAMKTRVVDAEQGLRLERLSLEQRQAQGIEQVERIMKSCQKLVITRELGRTLFDLDPNDWEVGAQRWARIEKVAETAKQQVTAKLEVNSKSEYYSKRAVILKLKGNVSKIESLLENSARDKGLTRVHEFKSPTGKKWDWKGLSIYLEGTEHWDANPALPDTLWWGNNHSKA